MFVEAAQVYMSVYFLFIVVIVVVVFCLFFAVESLLSPLSLSVYPPSPLTLTSSAAPALSVLIL